MSEADEQKPATVTNAPTVRSAATDASLPRGSLPSRRRSTATHGHRRPQPRVPPPALKRPCNALPRRPVLFKTFKTVDRTGVSI